MGNSKFRLSDMMPNAWFYKLKDKTKTNPQKTSTTNNSSSANPFKHKKMQPASTTATASTTISSAPSQPRKSYYFTREQQTPLPIKPDYLPNSPINPKISDVPFPESPTKSTKRKSSRRRRNIKNSSSSSFATTKMVNSSVSAGCSCRASLESVWTKSNSIPYYSSPSDSVSPPPGKFDSSRNEATTDASEGGPASSWSSTTTTTTTCSCRVSTSTTDIILDIDSKNTASSAEKFRKLDEFDTISEIELPPILTKPQKFINKERKETAQPMLKPPRRSSLNGGSSLLSAKVIKKEAMKSNTLKEQKISPIINRRSYSTSSPGLKLRANSPKILASRKIQACSKKTTMPSSTTNTSLIRSRKKNLSDSFAIIKSSFDPQRDFRESMVEMIVENNLRASKDLEELLACYLIKYIHLRLLIRSFCVSLLLITS